jgi:hypothetical protein
VFIPLVLWSQSFTASKFKFVFDSGGNEQTILLFQWIGIVTILVMGLVLLINFVKTEYNYRDVRNIFLFYLGSYILLSFLLTGIYSHPIEQYLYLINVVVILVVASKLQETNSLRDERPAHWIAASLCLVVVIALLAVIALQLNNKPMQDVGRFQL